VKTERTPIELLAFSIPEFCRRHGISRAHFYNLWKSGEGPVVMRVGRRTLVSAESAAAWRRRMEQTQSDSRRIRSEGAASIGWTHRLFCWKTPRTPLYPYFI